MEVVDRQIEAYNARDIDAFIACYAADALVEDGHSNVLMHGVDAIRARYEAFFREFPSLHCEIKQRIAVGAWAVDQEEITGSEPAPVAAVVAYHVTDDLIDRVLLLLS